MSKHFRDLLAETTFMRTYARYLPHVKRRETWPETVQRVVSHMKTVVPLTSEDEQGIYDAILRQEVLPSMRYMQFAGPAVDRNNLTIYNCSFLTIDSLEAFHDAMYLLMCGVGVGFSVEKYFISGLPKVLTENTGIVHQYSIQDNKESWAKALLFALRSWVSGSDVVFNYSNIRKRGERLNTMGGRASGPAPLKELMEFARERLFVQKEQWSSLLAMHIVCKIGQIVVSGSTRRSALICLSDLADDDIARAKSGDWFSENPHFSQANISAAYNDIPSLQEFQWEWDILAKSGSGERGIFNRYNAIQSMPKKRRELLSTLQGRYPDIYGVFENGNFSFTAEGPKVLLSTCYEEITSLSGVRGFVSFREGMYHLYHDGEELNHLGTNPCGEIILRDRGLCNLCSVICRPTDSVVDLERKVRYGAIIGTLQSSMTKFHHVSPLFKKNCEDERLLGVSLTGQIECPVLWGEGVLSHLRDVACETNVEYAAKWGINPSLAVTAVKPDGTVSVVVSATHGLHAAYSPYYIRRLRIGADDPIAHYLYEKGVPCHPENGSNWSNTKVYVFEFPIKAPGKALTRERQDEYMALERWMLLKKEYTQHNPSVTIDVRHEEWDGVGQWVYRHFKDVGGLSFLPFFISDTTHKLLPYEAVTEEQYHHLLASFPRIDFTDFVEEEDNVDPRSSSACSGLQCSRD
jgi:ribonucleoside-triphosphate reductase (thioredoxin)